MMIGCGGSAINIKGISSGVSVLMASNLGDDDRKLWRTAYTQIDSYLKHIDAKYVFHIMLYYIRFVHSTL